MSITYSNTAPLMLFSYNKSVSSKFKRVHKNLALEMSITFSNTAPLMVFSYNKSVSSACYSSVFIQIKIFNILACILNYVIYKYHKSFICFFDSDKLIYNTYYILYRND